MDIQGTCDPAFAQVRKAFVSNFADFNEVGASLAVTIDGRSVLDLWGGHADAERVRPWQQDTVVNVFSSTKGIVATAGGILCGRGQLDYDAWVSDYWPEFGQAGKANVLVRHLFDHRAGLPYLVVGSTLSDIYGWARAVGILEAQRPVWAPGTQIAYHAFTFGWLTGEVIRRITGTTVRDFVRTQIALPLGADFFIGAPSDDPVDRARIADVIFADRPADISGSGILPKYAMELHDAAIHAANTTRFRTAEIPAANGHANGRSLGRIYGALANGGILGDARVIDIEGLEQATAESASGYDPVAARLVRRSAGFSLVTTAGPTAWGPNGNAFGHGGAGGSLGFGDPDARLGFGYAMNQMRLDVDGNPCTDRLTEALYGCL